MESAVKQAEAIVLEAGSPVVAAEEQRTIAEASSLATPAAKRNPKPTKAKKVKVEMDPMSPPLAVLKLRQPEKSRKFSESLELMMNLTLDTRKQDQQLRLVADLPFGTGKQVRVAAFTTNPDAANAALAAGCDIVGGQELIDRMAKSQTIDFDKAVATADVLPMLAKVARLLGPRGLMPSKKLGTVVDDLAAAVTRAKAGSVELRADRGGTVHCGFGKISMTDDALIENLKAVVLAIENNKPAGVKGKKWVKSAFMKSSMGPSVPISLIHLDPKHQKFFSKD